jgi:3-methylcrotonyl-CoA carboxylase alpha subunit
MRSAFRMNAQPAARALKMQAGSHPYEVTFDPSFAGSSRWVERVDEGYLVNDLGTTFVFSPWRGGGQLASGAGDGAIVSPMPGKIIALEVAAGDAVTKGQKLLTLEAMKMEHSLTAPFDGKVAELNAAAGAQVSEGALLVRIEKGEGA